MYISRRVVRVCPLLILALVFACDEDDGASLPISFHTVGDGVEQSSCFHGGDEKSDVVERLLLTLESDGDLSIEHQYTMRNCAWAPAVETKREGDTIFVTESEEAWDAQAACSCCFSIRYSVENVDPDIYTLRLTKSSYNGESWEIDDVDDYPANLTTGSATIEIGHHGCM